MMRIARQAGDLRSFGRSYSDNIRQVEFPSAVEANPVCAVFNREHAAHVTVPAPKNKLEDT